MTDVSKMQDKAFKFQLLDSSNEEFWATAWDLSVLEPIGVGLKYDAFYESLSVLIGEKITIAIKTVEKTKDDASRMFYNINNFKA